VHSRRVHEEDAARVDKTVYVVVFTFFVLCRPKKKPNETVKKIYVFINVAMFVFCKVCCAVVYTQKKAFVIITILIHKRTPNHI